MLRRNGTGKGRLVRLAGAVCRFGSLPVATIAGEPVLKLKAGRQERRIARPSMQEGGANFALVSEGEGNWWRDWSWCSGTDVGRSSASARESRKRTCERYSRAWRRKRIYKDAGFSGGDQSVPVYGSLRHSSLLKQPLQLDPHPKSTLPNLVIIAPLD